MEPLLSVQNLSVEIKKGKRTFCAVDKISFDLFPAEICGLVGESGCGKSLTSLAIPGLLPPAAEASGAIILRIPEETQGRDLLTLGEEELCRIRGKEISFVFQEPMSSLNPLIKIGKQIAEALEIHGEPGQEQNRKKILALMRNLNLPDAENLMEAYPFMLSGGMCQRVMIALAMICDPRLLIADEPTTALDINTQDEVIKLLREINLKTGTSILFVSHNLGIINRICSRVIVMYAGKIMEEGPVEEVFSNPAHEYTRLLLGALPERGVKGKKLNVIPGRVPSIEEERVPGCPFAPRCSAAEETCRAAFPPEVIINERHKCRCIRRRS